MNIAIIIFLVLGIVGTGSIKINNFKISINWFCIVALILFIIKILR